MAKEDGMINTLEDLCKFWMPDDEHYLVISTNVAKNTLNYFGSAIASSFVDKNKSFVKAFIQHCYDLVLSNKYGSTSTTATKTSLDFANSSERLMEVKTFKQKNQVLLTKTVIKYIVKDLQKRQGESVFKQNQPSENSDPEYSVSESYKPNCPMIDYGHSNFSVMGYRKPAINKSQFGKSLEDDLSDTTKYNYNSVSEYHKPEELDKPYSCAADKSNSAQYGSQYNHTKNSPTDMTDYIKQIQHLQGYSDLSNKYTTNRPNDSKVEYSLADTSIFLKEPNCMYITLCNNTENPMPGTEDRATEDEVTMGIKEKILSFNQETSSDSTTKLFNIESEGKTKGKLSQGEEKNTENRFKCHICNHILNSDLILQNHLKEHAVFDGRDPNDHSCPICSKVFNFRKNLKEHYRLHTKPILYECAVCNKKFFRVASYKKHINVHKKNIVKNSQSQNNTETSSVDEGNNDTSNKDKETKNDCKTNQFLDLKEENLNTDFCLFDKGKQMTPMNQIWNELDAKYSCELCNKTFITRQDLSNHCRFVHSDLIASDDSLECRICNKTFCNQQSLQIHKRSIHEKLKEYVCGHCGRAFSRPYGLRTHMNTHDPNRKDRFSCSVCGKVLSSNRALKIHMRFHQDVTPFVCEICGKTFQQRSNYLIHKKYTHTPASFQCEKCPKILKSKQRWKIHMHLHTCREGTTTSDGNDSIFGKIYECHVCSKKFAIAYQLKCHLRTHSNERPFKCDKCAKSYKEYSKLKRHQMTVHSMSF